MDNHVIDDAALYGKCVYLQSRKAESPVRPRPTATLGGAVAAPRFISFGVCIDLKISRIREAVEYAADITNPDEWAVSKNVIPCSLILFSTQP